LILIRESGVRIELNDIQNESFIPKECMDTKNNEEFFASLVKHEAVFQELVKKADAKNCRLKFVATYDQGKASVGLQEIPKEHPFYVLEGKDNIVLFFTNRYQDQPLVIKGAGAGAEVTASGIFADVMRIAHS
jgi:aspartokinase/homoserine dehydrogenase 1